MGGVESTPVNIEQVENQFNETQDAAGNLPETTKEMPELKNVEANAPEDDTTEVNAAGLVSGQTFRAEGGAHEQLVELLSTTYGGSITGGNKGGNIESAIMTSIGGGLAILDNKQDNLRNSLKQSLTNLTVLKKFIEDGYDKIINMAYECEDKQLTSRLDSIKDIHKLLLEEFDRQIGILKNLLKVSIEPTSKSLSELINKHKDYMKVMELLSEYDYGSAEASDRLALVFNSLSKTNMMKDKVNKALKQVGMGLKEYKNTKNLRDLRKKLFDILKKLSSSKVEGEKVNDIFKAMKVLENHHADKEILGKGQTTFGGMMQAAAAEFGESYTGGAVDKKDVDNFSKGPSRSSIKKRTDLDSRIKSKQKTIVELMKSFIKDINLRFAEIKDSIEVVSNKIGDTIPYDDNMKEFINSYKKLKELENENIYFALIEYNDKAIFKQMKARYVDDLQIILKSLEPLIKGPQGTYFNHMKQNIEALLEVVDTYTNVYKGYKKAPIATTKGGKPVCETNKNKKLYKELLSNSVNAINETANKLEFYGKTAVIRQNLKATTVEIEKYKDGYEKTLGKAIGEELSRVNREYKQLVDAVDKSTYDDTKKNNLYTALKNQREGIVGLYKAIEAVDLYLMNFSDAISKNPNAVNELEKMLQNTQMISQWFVKKSGENFANLFKGNFNSTAEVYDNVQIAVESISVLKNIISMFIKIGNKFGAVDLEKKIHMSANVIYKHLVKYVWTSAIDLGKIDGYVDIYDQIKSENVKKYPTTVVGKTNEEYLKDINRLYTADDYFCMCIKAIVAKILTVVNTYSLFRTPEARYNTITNPVRLILGGSSDDTPTVIDDALELYMRLPLLVEFYKEIFEDGNDPYKKNNASDKKEDIIAFIPEVGSIWSGLIKIIFDKSRFITNSDVYTPQNMKDIVREVNQIYSHYSSKGKEKIVREAVLGLIAEINRRYGIMKRCDINEYYQIQKRNSRTYVANDAELQTNFDILDEANERNIAGPSAIYTEDTIKAIKNDVLVSTKDLKLINDFRDRVSKQLNENKLRIVSPYSFEQRIKFYKEELKTLSSNDSKFDLVMKAIENSNDTSKNNEEAYILFHELVINPIDVFSRLFYNTFIFLFRFNILYNIIQNINLTPENRLSHLCNLMDLIYTFTTDLEGLVEIKFITKNKMVIIYDKLQKLVNDSIENIKYNISKFRNIIDEKIIDNAENQIIYALEFVFLNHILKNEVLDTLNQEEKDKVNDILQQTSIFTQQDLQQKELPILQNFKDFNFDNITKKLATVLDNNPVLYNGDDALFKYIMYDISNKSAASIDPHTVNVGGPVDDAFKKYDRKNRKWDNLGATSGNTTGTIRIINDLYKLDGKSYSDNKGIVALFNQTLFNYLDIFYDKSVKKIYSKLFSKLAEETFSSVVYGKGLPDTVDETTTKNLTNEFPEHNVVLASSLAFTIKTLLNRSLNPQLKEKYHAVEELSNISPHMLERYRAYLPVFIKLFTLLSKKCLIFKHLLENNVCKAPITSTGRTGSPLKVSDDNDNIIDINLDLVSNDNNNEKRTNNYKQTLNNVIEGCQSLISSAQSVLDEVSSLDGKAGLFFELKNNFIKDYYNLTQNLPFMPSSLISYALDIKLDSGSALMLPNKSLNTDAFKFIYGTRGVLNGKNKQGLKDMPYMLDLFKKYNSSMRVANQLDTSNLEKTIDNTVCALRSIIDTNYYKQFLSKYPYYNINQRMTSIITNNFNIYTGFAPNTNLNTIINITENTFTENNKQQFYEYIINTNKNAGNNNILLNIEKSREYARLLNIIDLNIVPINIHALMKEIPLANMYNYAKTYENIIYNDLDITTGITNGIALFRGLLANPYANIQQVKDKHNKKQDLSTGLSDIMNGELTALHLFKPRFLSDQLWSNQVVNIDKNRDRFDKKVVRDAVWFVNIQRMLRRKVRNELSEIKSKIVDSNKVTSRQLTDWAGEHATQDDKEFEWPAM